MTDNERYERRGILGQGGFATVYRAWDRELRREVALKALFPQLSADNRTRRHFLREAQRLARLDHPGLVTVYDVGESSGQPFFTMRLIEGITLADLVLASAPLPVDRAARLLAELAPAVDYLHRRQVVHLDIKSANVMVEPGDRVTLMDLGIARTLDHTPLTLAGPMAGSPHSIAPEQLTGEQVGTRADIYALGVLAFELLCGRPPFTGVLPRLVYAHLHEPPPSPSSLRPDLPPELDAAVLAALAKRPEHRPASASVFAGSVASALGVQPSHAQTPAGGPRAQAVTTEAGAAAAHVAAAVTVPEGIAAAGHSRRRAGRRLMAGGAGLGIALLTGAALGLRPEVGVLDPMAPTAGVAPVTPHPATPPSPRVVVRDLSVWNAGELGGRSGPLTPLDSLAACFTLESDERVRLLAVVSSARSWPPDQPGIAARSETQEVEPGTQCLTVHSLRGPLPPGEWMLWLIAGAEEAARLAFTIYPEAEPPPPVLSPSPPASPTGQPNTQPRATASPSPSRSAPAAAPAPAPPAVVPSAASSPATASPPPAPAPAATPAAAAASSPGPGRLSGSPTATVPGAPRATLVPQD